MASNPSPSPQGRNTLASSGITIPSDSENYDGNNELSSPSPPSSSSSPMILYKPPTLWGLIRGAAINLLLPFVNGLMLGFGELVANEAAYRLGWSGTKIFPTHRSGSDSRRVGPGVEMRADPVERRRRSGQEMDAYTSLE
ncbi:TOM13-domain-containing protein [Lentithecium fluviatile CBS 122367]|uniref:TOM13-domain-containing protein n=1 Tax=Lentithecium fluviatile CBS 122367 TaxID=1168545 RepID=A0A6G1J4B3_9PLEO|nr:TOM13-domain-containing protein [Lentithecium fluviatile CBS 122367]